MRQKHKIMAQKKFKKILKPDSSFPLIVEKGQCQVSLRSGENTSSNPTT